MEGLRAQKKRETRQRISDVATEMFIARGFDQVTISEIAAVALVSEKTVYNYFPTKESLVFDKVDEQRERLVTAVRDRTRGTTVTAAFVAALKTDSGHFSDELGSDHVEMVEKFGAMVRDTPALQAAWGEYRHRLVAELTAVLAADLAVDPIDPEPVMAARSLVGLLELQYDSLLRHMVAGAAPSELLELVSADIDRGARLLDTGLWSLHVMVEGRRTKEQIRDAAARAEQVSQQVLAALRRARREWDAECRANHAVAWEARRQAQIAAREAQRQAREAAREAREQARAAAREAREQAMAQAQEARAQIRAAVQDAKQQARRPKG